MILASLSALSFLPLNGEVCRASRSSLLRNDERKKTRQLFGSGFDGVSC